MPAFLSALLLGVGLSMDAFAVALCKGLAVRQVKPKHLLSAGLWFGAFQALMPLLGYLLGASFHVYIERIDHWVAFALLLLIGGNMLREAFFGKEDEGTNSSFSPKVMLPMAVATSIDALAVGIALAMDASVNIWLNVGVVGVTTFLLSALGVKLGALVGKRFEKKAQIAGGVILILLGVKILLEHLGVI